MNELNPRVRSKGNHRIGVLVKRGMYPYDIGAEPITKTWISLQNKEDSDGTFSMMDE